MGIGIVNSWNSADSPARRSPSVGVSNGQPPARADSCNAIGQWIPEREIDFPVKSVNG